MSDTNSEWPGRTGDPNTTAPIGPPPAGAPVGLVDPPPPVPDFTDWQGKYESERKRSRIFMATTAVAAALLVGSLFYASAQGGSAGSDTAQVPGTGQGMGPQGMGRGGMDSHGFDDDSDSGSPDQQFGGPGVGGGMGVPPGMAEQFFTTDGSLDEDAVAQFKEQLEAAGTSADTIKQQLAAQIAGDVERGHLTAEQAEELTKALDLPESTGGTDGTDGTSGTGT